MAGKLSPADAAKHISRLIAKWPKDPVRPEEVSVQTYLKTRLSLPTPPRDPSFLSRLTSVFSKPTPPQPQGPGSSTPPLLSQKNINALYSLVENRYMARYPLRRNVRYPASQPDYYDRLLKEFSEAAQRSTFDRIKKRVSGSLRLK